MRWLARAVAVGAVMAASLAACSFEQPTHEAVFPANETHPRAMPVRFHDRVGIVQEIQVQQLGAEWWKDWSEVPANPDGQVAQALISWTGGACEDATVMDFREDGPGYVLAMTLEHGPIGGCPAVGIPRQILITFNKPVDATTIRMERP